MPEFSYVVTEKTDSLISSIHILGNMISIFQAQDDAIPLTLKMLHPCDASISYLHDHGKHRNIHESCDLHGADNLYQNYKHYHLLVNKPFDPSLLKCVLDKFNEAFQKRLEYGKQPVSVGFFGEIIPMAQGSVLQAKQLLPIEAMEKIIDEYTHYYDQNGAQVIADYHTCVARSQYPTLSFLYSLPINCLMEIRQSLQLQFAIQLSVAIISFIINLLKKLVEYRQFLTKPMIERIILTLRTLVLTAISDTTEMAAIQSASAIIESILSARSYPRTASVFSTVSIASFVACTVYSGGFLSAAISIIIALCGPAYGLEIASQKLFACLFYDKEKID